MLRECIPLWKGICKWLCLYPKIINYYVQNLRISWITADTCQRTTVGCGHFPIQVFREIINCEKDQKKNWSKRKQKPPPSQKNFLQSKKDWTDYKKPILINFEMNLRNKLTLKTFSTRHLNKFYLGSCFILDILLCFMLITYYRTNCNSSTHWRWGYQSSWQWCVILKCTPCCTELTVGNEIPLVLFSYQCQ